MRVIQRYLRWALLGLIIVLTASINLFCVVIDNDDDGDPTTGVTIEFHVVPGKRVQVAASLVHVQSTLASRLFGSVFFSRQPIERSNDLESASRFFDLVDLLASPLRC